MKLYIINLKEDTERKKYIEQQLKNFNITNYEFFTASRGIESKYDRASSVKLIGRPLCSAEIGCALSHRQIYVNIIKQNERAIILEDDICISKDFVEILDKKIDDAEDKENIIFYGCSTSLYKPTQDNDIFIARHGKTCYLPIENHNRYFYKIKNDNDFNIWGTHAYSPSITACKKLIKLNSPIKLASDHIWNIHKFNCYVMVGDLINVNENIKSNIEEERAQIVCGYKDIKQ